MPVEKKGAGCPRWQCNRVVPPGALCFGFGSHADPHISPLIYTGQMRKRIPVTEIVGTERRVRGYTHMRRQAEREMPVRSHTESLNSEGDLQRRSSCLPNAYTSLLTLTHTHGEYHKVSVTESSDRLEEVAE